MIAVEQLRYAYPPLRAGGAWSDVLDGVSFNIPAGSCTAITGASGCGRTTLCLSVAGLAPRLTSGRLEGRIRVAGRDVQREPAGALAGVIGLVMQDPAGQLFNPTLEDEIAWGLGNLGVPVEEMEGRIAGALALAGLGHLPRERAPQTLSGGEQKRLALAAALALAPRVLILDEPAGGLAPAARAEMIAVLGRLRREAGLTIVLAESDPEVIAALADNVLLLDGGRIAAQGSPRAVYGTLDRRVFAGVPSPAASRFGALIDPPLDCLTVEEAAAGLRARGLPADRPLEPVPASGAGADQPAVAVEGLTFAYDPARPVLRDVNLSLRSGEITVLAGDNGAGKTTLARHLIGLLRPAAGRIRVLGVDAAGLRIGQLAHRVGFAFQNPELQIFNPTVREEIAFGPRNLGREAAVREAVEAALRRFDLKPMADDPPAALSFSARRMVALAAVAAMQTPVLVLDEPTVGLDLAGQALVLGWLADRRREGAAILLITHDMEVAAACADRVVVLEAGEITADGPPADVFRQTEALGRAGLRPPFAIQLAEALGLPAPSADLTPEGAARAWQAAAAQEARR